MSSNVDASAESFDEDIDLSRLEPNRDVLCLLVMHPYDEQHVTTRRWDPFNIAFIQQTCAGLMHPFSVGAIPRHRSD